MLDAEYKERKSWVVWNEDGKYPNLILEILSDTTAHIDRGLKKQIYQDIFRTPEYFWFDPYSLEFVGFRLKDARDYEQLTPTEQGWYWSQQLELYLGIVEERLRFFTPEGELVPAPKEVAIQEQQRAEVERQRAEAEQQRAEQAEALAEAERQRAEQAEARADFLQRRLQEMGIDPNELQ